MMVAMTISTFLIAGSITIYVQTRQNYRTADSIARLQESAHFALDTLEPDLRLAGFWGFIKDEGKVRDAAAAIVFPCAAPDFLLTSPAVEAWDDDANNFPCAFRTAPRLDSDVLTVRHASADPANLPLAAGRIPVVSKLGDAAVFDDGAEPPGYGVDPTYPEYNPFVRDVVMNSYYVSDFTDFYPGLPSLRRLSLDANGNWDDQEIIPGVENMQVQFGIDTDADPDNVVDQYLDPEHPALVGNPVLSVRLWLLVRSEIAESGYADDRVYPTPDETRPTLVPGGAAYPPEYRRIAVTKTVLLNNELNDVAN